jgi:hypothetical protein
MPPGHTIIPALGSIVISAKWPGSFSGDRTPVHRAPFTVHRRSRHPGRAVAELQAEHAVIFSEEPMSTTHGAALVSGASRGLGAVIARRLAADGWPVAVNYRSELERDEAGHVVQDILARGGTAEAFAADITNEAATAGLVCRATDQLGSIDVLVVNATGPQRSCRSRS